MRTTKCDYRALFLVNFAVSSQGPSSVRLVHDHDVCGSKLNLTIPKPNTNFMKSSLAYSGAVVWNSLDEATKTCDSLSAFKNRINSNM